MCLLNNSEWSRFRTRRSAGSSALEPAGRPALKIFHIDIHVYIHRTIDRIRITGLSGWKSGAHGQAYSSTPCPSQSLFIQGSPKEWFHYLVKFVTVVAYHFCLNLPEAFSQPRMHSFDDPCIRSRETFQIDIRESDTAVRPSAVLGCCPHCVASLGDIFPLSSSLSFRSA